MYPAKFNDRVTKYAHETDTPCIEVWVKQSLEEPIAAVSNRFSHIEI